MVVLNDDLNCKEIEIGGAIPLVVYDSRDLRETMSVMIILSCISITG